MEKFQGLYSRLNDRQKEAVDALDCPVLVLAGPGTGKTQLLSVRAANIINSKKASPENILIVTFTNAAAREMRERIVNIVGRKGYDVVVETFHSFANSVVLESEGALKYVKDKIEIGEVEKIRAFEYIMDNVKGVEPLRPFGSPYIHRSEIEKRISELKNEGISPKEFKESLKNVKADGTIVEDKDVQRLHALAVIYEEYERLKESENKKLFDERGRIDYDDMIIIALSALRQDKDLADSFRKQFKYIMVDEYQDTNGAQLELLFSILDPAAPNICCVGDDDQAIYRFQGATLSNFRILREKLPKLKSVTLAENYRSEGNIIETARRIISLLPDKERIAVKNLKACRKYSGCDIRLVDFLTEEEELAFIVAEIKRQAGIIRNDMSLSEEDRDKPFNNIAVLVRKRSQILKVVKAFLLAGIPYATDGDEDIRQEKRVRQMLDVVDLAGVSPDDPESKSLILYKMLTADYIGAELSDVLKIMDHVNKKRGVLSAGGNKKYIECDFFQQFMEYFAQFKNDKNGISVKPSLKETEALEILNILTLKEPHVLHRAAWAIDRLLTDARHRPVHDILMQYIEDSDLYAFILKRYSDDRVIRVRELRALVSFINLIKRSDLADPALGLDDFLKELELREIHDMPIRGELATLSQDGVRIYTAHKSKGLEFYTVFIPFCLQQKSWPIRKKPDVVDLPADIYTSKERVDEKNRIKELALHDELRLFYVASTRAKASLIYTATPLEKAIISPFISGISIKQESGAPADEEKFLGDFLRMETFDVSEKETADILKDIIGNLTLNPTSVNNYITCRRKFLYNDVLRLPGKKNQQLTFGNCAHKALEDVYKEFMDTGKFPGFQVFKRIFLRELEFHGINDAIRRGCLDKLERVRTWYEKQEASPVMPLELENKLEIYMTDGLVFRGKFDKVEPCGDGEVKVVDYKTGKPDDHAKDMQNCRDLSSADCDDYFRQLVAYKLLYDKNQQKTGGKALVTKGVIQFLEPAGSTVKKYGLEKGAYMDIAVDLNDEMSAELVRTIEGVWGNIKKLSFEQLPEKDNDKCGFCPYADICWQDE